MKQILRLYSDRTGTRLLILNKNLFSISRTIQPLPRRASAFACLAKQLRRRLDWEDNAADRKWES